MGRFGHYVIDADGHGGEPLGWRRRIPARFETTMREYVAAMRAQYASVPGGGMRVANSADEVAPAEDDLEFGTPIQPGMFDPEKRMPDMDQEGIDVAVLFPPGSGEEWAMDSPAFSAALCTNSLESNAMKTAIQCSLHCIFRPKTTLKHTS